MHLKNLFLKEEFAYHLWQGRKYSFSFLIFKDSTLDLHTGGENSLLFLYIEKTFSFFFF